MKVFDGNQLKNLYNPAYGGTGVDNGQVTIIGGSKLFHGAPLLSLKVASRIVDMVFFASPEPSVGKVAEHFKSKFFSYIWVPWDEVENYIKKSNAVLIGPGLMRFAHESVSNKIELGKDKHDEAGRFTREITQRLLTKFPEKAWVIDAGSLQVMDVDWIPKGAIVTPNEKEYKILFQNLASFEAAQRYDCIINSKGQKNIVCSPEECVEIPGGNAGLTKGGVGDVLAGLTVSFLAKNKPFLAAASASFVVKYAADELFKKIGTNYSSDDLADHIPLTIKKLQY